MSKEKKGYEFIEYPCDTCNKNNCTVCQKLIEYNRKVEERNRRIIEMKKEDFT